MISRYSREDMARLWSRGHTYTLWLRVELLALEGMERSGIAPAGLACEIARKARIDIARVDALEATLNHEVISFLTSVSEQVGPPARHLHYGMTSSDMLDTALALQITEALDQLDQGLIGLQDTIQGRAWEHKHTPCLARTHGRGAEPTTFGVKLSGYHAEFTRCRRRMQQARSEIAFCKLSGTVGIYSALPPEVEAYVAERLGFSVEPAPTQAIPRDRHAAVATALSLLAGAIERFSVDIRHMQRQEVGEVSEFFDAAHKGSSAMPHKRNPIYSENLTGLARLIRGASLPMLESIALWESRDMSHSSVERVSLPDAFILADFAIDRLQKVVAGLIVYPDAMNRNLQAMNSSFMSQKVLLALIRAGQTREAAYELVQTAAIFAAENGIELKEAFARNSDILKRIPAAELDDAADVKSYLHHIDLIMHRTLGVVGESVTA